MPTSITHQPPRRSAALPSTAAAPQPPATAAKSDPGMPLDEDTAEFGLTAAELGGYASPSGEFSNSGSKPGLELAGKLFTGAIALGIGFFGWLFGSREQP